MSAAASDGGGRGIGLERERIVTEALGLLDEAGYAQLTLRRLAARLNVQAAALYWHFRNKQDLIDAMATRMIEREMPKFDMLKGSWRDLLRGLARANREALMRHRDGSQIFAHANMGRTPVTHGLQALRANLIEQGFSQELALVSTFTMLRFTLGCVFEEQADPHDDDPHMAAIRAKFFDPQKQFEQGLDFILDGIAAHLKTTKQ
jgi:TetR/AcrR family transcriptional regulator, tetracycline repressor protein